jgi:hypothetical protein
MTHQLSLEELRGYVNNHTYIKKQGKVSNKDYDELVLLGLKLINASYYGISDEDYTDMIQSLKDFYKDNTNGLEDNPVSLLSSGDFNTLINRVFDTITSNKGGDYNDGENIYHEPVWNEDYQKQKSISKLHQ